MSSSNECKQFLSHFFASNDDPLREKLRDNGNLFKDACNPKLWEFEWECTPDESDFHKGPAREYEITNIDNTITYRTEDDFVIERGCFLTPEDEYAVIRFMVVEDSSGNLYLADYYGL